MSIRDSILDLIKRGKPLTSQQISDELNSIDRVEISRTLGSLKKSETIVKCDEGLWRMTKRRTVVKGMDPGFVPDTPASVDEPLDHTVEVIIDEKLTDLEKHLAILPKSISNYELKQNVIKRLGLLLDPNIAAVLDNISKDLEAVHTE